MVHKEAFAFKSPSALISEAAQIIAISNGYTWPQDPWKDHYKPQHCHEPYLVFFPKTKEINFSSDASDFKDLIGGPIVMSINKLIELLKKPPVATLKVGIDVINSDGSVLIGERISAITSEEFDKVVTERNTFLGRKEKKRLPIVSFTYSNVKRKVIVTEMAYGKILGLDTSDGNQFKTFIILKIKGPIEFLGFTED